MSADRNVLQQKCRLDCLNSTASDQERIASELVSTLKKTWDRFHVLKLKNGALRVGGDVFAFFNRSK